MLTDFKLYGSASTWVVFTDVIRGRIADRKTGIKKAVEKQIRKFTAK